ncbi:Flp family type IVb pilin [Sphingomonas paeninsulae]|jgi:pilus assembly protein Flp/PilA|uniref:Flp family type IVb pilin n=1 Tax=Sphingomonas paeninsulae TaxID=2319844 RepID=A0A494TDK9_SPHPE|nr:Flp family type IVb pilin [Sphingomonas paeninsulae]AYJ87619.1 Flp family type IVb pilin [Sphingomonas paeninsulae]
MLKLMRALALNKKGATAVEYGLIVALVCLGMLAGLQALGAATSGLWNNISTKVQNAN